MRAVTDDQARIRELEAENARLRAALTDIRDQARRVDLALDGLRLLASIEADQAEAALQPRAKLTEVPPAEPAWIAVGDRVATRVDHDASVGDVVERHGRRVRITEIRWDSEAVGPLPAAGVVLPDHPDAG